MKKVILLVAVFLTGCDQGSAFITPDLKPDAVRRIESKGFDLRVYEFTPITAPSMQCLFVAGERKGGVTCFEKPTKETS